jgi:hypothetical protein
VHPPAAETGYLARREQPGHRTVRRFPAQYPAGQVGLQAAQRFAGQDVEPHRDQRARLGVEDPVRRGGAGQPFTARAAGVANRHDLQILGERVSDLPVAGDDLPFQVGQLDERLRGELVHARHEFGQRA